MQKSLIGRHCATRCQTIGGYFPFSTKWWSEISVNHKWFFAFYSLVFYKHRLLHTWDRIIFFINLILFPFFFSFPLHFQVPNGCLIFLVPQIFLHFFFLILFITPLGSVHLIRDRVILITVTSTCINMFLIAVHCSFLATYFLMSLRYGCDCQTWFKNIVDHVYYTFLINSKKNLPNLPK